MSFRDTQDREHKKVLLISRGLPSEYALDNQNYIIECIEHNHFNITILKNTSVNEQLCISSCKMLMKEYFYCADGYPDGLLSYTDFKAITEKLRTKSGDIIKDAYSEHIPVFKLTPK